MFRTVAARHIQHGGSQDRNVGSVCAREHGKVLRRQRDSFDRIVAFKAG